MLKKENLRKNFLRVKQIADQNLGRAEKTEVLSEDLQSVEKRVELVKHVIQTLSKKVAASLQSSGGDVEKRLKKLPETSVAHCLIENASLLGEETVMGNMFQISGDCQSTLASNALQYEIDVEKDVLIPLQEILDNDLPAIGKCKKQLTKLTLDMDSARSRYNQAVKQTQVHGTNIGTASAKADTVKGEMEECENRMMQARDNLATEMYNFISKEAEHSQKLLVLMETQAEYHRKAYETFNRLIPKMKEVLETNPHKPVFGIPLQEHLRVTGRDIALPLEACVVTLLETGIEEEGLFRIAGMANRVKKLKKSFDAGMVDMEEYSLDPHSVAGVMKQYLREMSEPLLTHQLFDEFLAAARLPQDQRLQALWTSLHTLPDINFNNFRYLIKFLSKLADKSDINKMTASNISIVIGPNLLWSEGDDGPNMLNSGTISNLIESIIIHADWFFPEAVDFQRTKQGTAPPRQSRRTEDKSEVVTPQVVERQHSKPPSVGKAGGVGYVTAMGPISSQGSDTSSQEGVAFVGDSQEQSGDSSSASYQSMSALDDDDKLNPFFMDETEEGTTDTDQGQGEGHRVTSNTSCTPSSSLLSSFSSVSKYTNPPVLKFNPQDMHKSCRARSAPPPPSSSAKDVHSDVYNTVFALHSLGNGDVTDYLSKVRALWDGHMQQRPISSSSGVINNSSGGGSRLTDTQRRSLGQAVEFGHYTSFVSQTSGSSLSEGPDMSDQESSGNQVSYTNTGSPSISLSAPNSPSVSSSSPVANSNNSLSSPTAPIAESEQISPKVQRRVTRKPAPPPPPTRPYSVAVSAAVSKQIQSQTWPRQALVLDQPEGTEEVFTEKTTKMPPERPDKPGLMPQKFATLDRTHSHMDRPSVPPPGRPKIPPPVVPQHHRSASTGSPALANSGSVAPNITPSPSHVEQGYANKTDSL